MFAGMDHVGVAVKNLDKAIKIYHDILGFELEGIHTMNKRKVRVAFLSSGGQTGVELLEPLDRDSTIAKFLDTRGEGIHHFAMRVKNIEATLEDLKKKGVGLIDDKPSAGVGEKKIAFVHPKSTIGVLLELCELP